MPSTPKKNKDPKKIKKKKEDPNKMGIRDSIQLLQIFIGSVVKLGKENGFEEKAEQSRVILLSASKKAWSASSCSQKAPAR